MMMSVTVPSAPIGELGVPQVLCIDPPVTTNGRHVDVARDGRLLMINTDTSSRRQIALVRNWVEELEARVWVP